MAILEHILSLKMELNILTGSKCIGYMVQSPMMKDKPVGMTHSHLTENVCRVDYLLVSKEHRNIGVGRSLINCFVEYCKTNGIDNCYLWPDGETAEKIYYEAGFRLVDIKLAGRAVYK